MVQKAKPQPQPQPADVHAPQHENDDDAGYSLASVVELTDEVLASMARHLDGEARLGPNLAVLGFFKKRPGAQLIGVVRSCQNRPDRFNPGAVVTILYIEGTARYDEDIYDNSGALSVRKGDHTGIFGFQTDAGTMALDSDLVGGRVHIKVRAKELLPSGLSRYAYDFARVSFPARTRRTEMA